MFSDVDKCSTPANSLVLLNVHVHVVEAHGPVCFLQTKFMEHNGAVVECQLEIKVFQV